MKKLLSVAFLLSFGAFIGCDDKKAEAPKNFEPKPTQGPGGAGAGPVGGGGGTKPAAPPVAP